MKITTVVLAFIVLPHGAYAQQYRNLEVRPNTSGGYSGTYGNQNFQTAPNYRRAPSGTDRRFNSNSPAVVIPNEGVTGNTLKRCYATGNGNVVCR